jgi:hypothetical protein
MNLKELIGRRKVVFLVFLVFATIAAGLVMLIYTTRPVTNLEPAGVQAKHLITSAGGPAKVCDEANQMFKRFGVTEVKFFDPADLKDFPALTALGTVRGIWPGSPPRISIRVGTHQDGFFFDIADTNSPGKYPKTPDTLELVDSCVFVHR